ncbi:MAG TPA: hypothetical protein VFJ19_09515 [Nocardioidaceae bacterium]|nr:hypothetical protein [Nocardioidaceae bacterium]
MTERPADKDTGEIQVRPFSAWLTEQSGGRTHDELSDGLHDLIARVQDTGKKGSISLIVHVEPAKDTVALIVHDEIKLKLPEHDRKASLFFIDATGNLTRHDPRQMTLPLRDVSAPTPADPKDIAK